MFSKSLHSFLFFSFSAGSEEPTISVAENDHAGHSLHARTRSVLETVLPLLSSDIGSLTLEASSRAELVRLTSHWFLKKIFSVESLTCPKHVMLFFGATCPARRSSSFSALHRFDPQRKIFWEMKREGDSLTEADYGLERLMAASAELPHDRTTCAALRALRQQVYSHEKLVY